MDAAADVMYLVGVSWAGLDIFSSIVSQGAIQEAVAMCVQAYGEEAKVWLLEGLHSVSCAQPYVIAHIEKCIREVQ